MGSKTNFGDQKKNFLHVDELSVEQKREKKRQGNIIGRENNRAI